MAVAALVAAAKSHGCPSAERNADRFITNSNSLFSHLTNPSRVGLLVHARYGGTGIDLGQIETTLWNEIITLASAHAVLPALASAARNLPGGLDAAGDAGVFLAEIEDANDRRNSRIKDQLLAIGAALDKAGIPVVALKGAAFSLNDPAGAAGWRFSQDLDILVPAAAVELAANILAGMDYAHPGPPYRPVDWHHYPALIHADGETVVEIHRRLLPQPNFPLLPAERVLDNAQPALSDTTVKVPRRDDRLIHLIVHAQCNSLRYKRRFILLRDVCDLMELVTDTDDPERLDWEPIRAGFAEVSLEPELAGFLAAAEHVMAPLFKAPPWAEDGRSWAISALSGLSGSWRVRLRYAGERLVYFSRELALNSHRRRLAWSMLTDAQLRRNFINNIAAQWRNMR